MHLILLHVRWFGKMSFIFGTSGEHFCKDTQLNMAEIPYVIKTHKEYILYWDLSHHQWEKMIQF